MQSTSQHILYQYPSCPFCARVRHFLDSTGIEVPMKDILQDQQAYRELVLGGGSQQVPCLRIESPGDPEPIVHWLYESADIIAYLQQQT